jgi:hypothetical protein
VPPGEASDRVQSHGERRPAAYLKKERGRTTHASSRSRSRPRCPSSVNELATQRV